MPISKSTKSLFLLIITAMIWGFSFVVQKTGTDFVGPFLFNGLRSVLAAFVLLVFILISNKVNSQKNTEKTALNTDNLATLDTSNPENNLSTRLKVFLKSDLAKGGFFTGTALAIGINMQQAALVFTSASKAGFLTALYIVLVPIFGLFLKQKIYWNVWVSVIIATVGLYFLCLTEALSIAPGDLVVVISAIFWAVHILVVDFYSPKVNAIKLSCVQFFVASAWSFLLSIFFDHFFMKEIIWANIVAVIPALLYVGIMSSCVGFTLQIYAQKNAKPSAASITLSLESVFATIGGFIVLGEVFTTRELLGCVLLFVAVTLAQIQVKKRNNN